MRRRDPDLWAEVLQETNQFRRQLIDQVKTAVDFNLWLLSLVSVCLFNFRQSGSFQLSANKVSTSLCFDLKRNAAIAGIFALDRH